jgi:hypothetical protein
MGVRGREEEEEEATPGRLVMWKPEVVLIFTSR